MDNVIVQLSALLSITVGIALLLRVIRQPLIISYIVAGIICGPFILNLFNGDHHLYDTFAEFGVVLLLFIIGLNLNFRHLKSIGKVSFLAGMGQVFFTGTIGYFILYFLTGQVLSSLYLAVAMVFSSTIIIMKMLSDKKDVETTYGRYTIGVMLVQDVLAVILIVLLGFFKSSESIEILSFLLLFTKGAVIVGLVYLLSKKFLPLLLDRLASSTELLFIFTIAWCFGLSSLMLLAGFSIEIGAIIAGMALSSSPYQFEIASRLKPLRDFFLILFFIVLGGELALTSLSTIIFPAIILSLFILIGNPLILYLVFRSQKFTRRNSFLAGITAAQVSEFGFVLLFAGRQIGHVHEIEVGIFTAVAITTIFASSYLITYGEQIYRKILPLFLLFGQDKHQQKETTVKSYDAWIVGYHRIGIKVVEALKKSKRKFSVIDFNPEVIKKLKKSKIPHYFGDIADVEFLESLPFGNCKIIIMTIPTIDDQINLINFIRKNKRRIVIIANAYQKDEATTLYAHGADFVMMPHFLGGQWISSILQKTKLSKITIKKLKAEQEKMLIGS